MLDRTSPKCIVCPLCGTRGSAELKRTTGDVFFMLCCKCGLHFIHSETQGSLNFSDYPWTKEYTEKYNQYLLPVLISLKEKVRITEKIIGRRPTSFLDIGCGNGLYLKAAENLGLRNLGIDVDIENIKFAKEKGLRVMAVNLENLELNERFDFIHIKAVLHLVNEPVRFILKAKKLLEPGGIIYLDVPNQGSLFSKLRILRDRSSYGQLQLPFRRSAFNDKSLRFLCKITDLKIMKKVYIYPGDYIYYPNYKIGKILKACFQIMAFFHVASLLGVYVCPKE